MGTVRRRSRPGKGSSLPITGEEFQWWTDEVRKRLAEREIDQKQLSRLLRRDEGAVSRCINRKVPVYDLVKAISEELQVPMPLLFFKSESEAAYMHKYVQIFRVEQKLDEDSRRARASVETATGVEKPPLQHASPIVASAHGRRSPKGAKG